MNKKTVIEKIKKVTSGSTPETADIVDAVYNSVLVNGTHKAPTIKVAEASKIIENSQRDVNIAFMRLFRESKGNTAYSIVESDGLLPENIAEEIRKSPNVSDVMIIQL